MLTQADIFILLIPLLPLVGAAVCALFTGEESREAPVSIIACTAVGLSFLAGVVSFFCLRQMSSMEATTHLWTWMALPPLNIEFSFYLDPLSMIMVLVVTGVSFLIHVYSAGYMKDDPGYSRYFAFLNLFVFFMCWLVLSGNVVMMFIGWEGVAFCSWGLIGFWFSDEENAQAGNKAFLVNRIGDFAFLIGIFLLFWTQVQTHVQLDVAKSTLNLLDFEVLMNKEHMKAFLGNSGTILGLSLPLVIGLCLLLGATGKSAQVPLYIWLPDAMAGPTPVSALIHAATMVTAGVYMICRFHVLFVEMAPVALTAVAMVGGVTLFVAALLACFETDFKKILAYSTISQIGYMFLGVGVGAFTAGMFHLVTHAFFKALLFLCSGAVLHALSGIGDIRKMGGLRKEMPVTFWTFVIGALALVGIPPFAGFWSKDEILWLTFSGKHGSTVLWVLGTGGVILTGFYTFRLLLVSFTGEDRTPADAHPHEAGSLMTFPMMLLAVLSVVGGLIGIPHVIGDTVGFPNWIVSYLEHAGYGGHGTHGGGAMQLGFMGISVAAGLTGAFVAWFRYGVQGVVPPPDPELHEQPLRRFFQKKLYVNELGYHGLVRPIEKFAYGTWKGFETIVIDTLFVNGSALSVRVGSWIYSLVQNGNIGRYLFWIWFGAIAIVLGMLST